MHQIGYLFFLYVYMLLSRQGLYRKKNIRKPVELYSQLKSQWVTWQLVNLKKKVFRNSENIAKQSTLGQLVGLKKQDIII